MPLYALTDTVFFLISAPQGLESARDGPKHRVCVIKSAQSAMAEDEKSKSEAPADTDAGPAEHGQPADATEASAAPDDAADGPEDTAAAEPGGDGDDADPVQALLAAEEKIAALHDQALRAQAEVENVRRRAALDVEKARKFALDKFVNDLLPVVDSLEKAVELGGDADSAQSEGVSLSLKLFLDALGKSGVEQLDPTGEPFDPQHHEAMSMIEHPDMEPNSVVDTMQKGYVLNGRLVRAAMVVVCKAPANAGGVDEQA